MAPFLTLPPPTLQGPCGSSHLRPLSQAPTPPTASTCPTAQGYFPRQAPILDSGTCPKSKLTLVCPRAMLLMDLKEWNEPEDLSYCGQVRAGCGGCWGGEARRTSPAAYSTLPEACFLKAATCVLTSNVGLSVRRVERLGEGASCLVLNKIKVWKAFFQHP